MNIVPRRRVVRLAAIGAFAMALPLVASAHDLENGATFQLAMGPMSAAQTNQGTSVKSDDAMTKPHHHTRHRHAHHAK